MSHYTKFNHVQSPEPVTGQICSLFDCQGLGHGPASGARGEVLLPGCRAQMLIKKKYSQLHSIYPSFIHSFCRDELRTCFVLETRNKILDNFYLSFMMQQRSHQFYDEFPSLTPPQQSQVFPPDAPAFSVNTSTIAHTIQNYIDVSSSFSLIYCEFLEDRYCVLFILASPDTNSRHKALKKPLLTTYMSYELFI